MQTRFLSLPTGVCTRVVEAGAGTGPVLVLVHGLANSVEIWSRVLPRLAARHRVVAFDLPGFGEADRPAGAYDGAFFARHLAGVLDALRIDRAHLVGSSLGASVALRHAVDDPGRVARVVLAAPGGFTRRVHPLMLAPALPLVGGWLGRPTPANTRRTLALAMHDPAQVTPDLLALTDRHAAVPGSARAFARSLRSGVGLFGTRDMAGTARRATRLQAPALLLWGRQDRVFPAAGAQQAARLIPDARVRLIDACGHYPHWEQPAAFAEAVLAFLP